MTLWDHCCGLPALPPVGWLFQLVLLTQPLLLTICPRLDHTFSLYQNNLGMVQPPRMPSLWLEKVPRAGITDYLLYSEPLLLLLGSLKQAGGRTLCILLIAQLNSAGYDIDLLGMGQLGKSGPGVGFCSF